MDYPKIEYFLKAADKLSFTDAAKDLFITPQALSHQIAQLEQELGTKLFERSTRKIRLTETGRYCQARFSSAKKAVDEALHDVQMEIERVNSIIHVGFFNGLPKNEVVSPWLQKLQRCSAGSQLELTSGDLLVLWKALSEDKLDMLLTNMDTHTDTSDYQVTVLLSMPAMVVVSVNHPWADRTKVTTEELRTSPMLQLQTSDRSVGHSFYRSMGNMSIKYVADFDTMLATLESGCYFAVFPQSFDFHERARFKYIELPAEHRFAYQTVFISKKSPLKAKVADIQARFANCD